VKLVHFVIWQEWHAPLLILFQVENYVGLMRHANISFNVQMDSVHQGYHQLDKNAKMEANVLIHYVFVQMVLLLMEYVQLIFWITLDAIQKIIMIVLQTMDVQIMEFIILVHVLINIADVHIWPIWIA